MNGQRCQPPTEVYDYKQVGKFPCLLAFYIGWLCQKVCYLVNVAFLDNDKTRWVLAQKEVFRLLWTTWAWLEGQDKNRSNVPEALREHIGRLLRLYHEKSYWGSAEGRDDRTFAMVRGVPEECWGDSCADQNCQPFWPSLLGDPGEPSCIDGPILTLRDFGTAVGEALQQLPCLELGIAASGLVHNLATRHLCTDAAKLQEDMRASDLLPPEEDAPETDSLLDERITVPLLAEATIGPPPKETPAVLERRFGEITPWGNALTDYAWQGYKMSLHDLLTSAFARLQLQSPPRDSDVEEPPDIPAALKRACRQWSEPRSLKELSRRAGLKEEKFKIIAEQFWGLLRLSRQKWQVCVDLMEEPMRNRILDSKSITE